MKTVSARDLALKVLYSVNEEDAYSNIALNKALTKYNPEKLDRSFSTELVYGVLRALGTLDWVLGQFLKKPLKELSPWVRNILRMGVYQLMMMDKVPPSAAVNESVNLAKKYGHQGIVKFVNGVLRNVERGKENITYPDLGQAPVQHIAVKYSHPEWLVERWIKEFGVEQTILICTANNTNPPNTIRTNTLKISRVDLVDKLAAEEVMAENCLYASEGLQIKQFQSIGRIAAFNDGLFQVQDESSMLVAPALAPTPGSLVIDACSAPGGKTTHLAQLMGNRGRIIAADIHRHKMALIAENSTRLGIDIIEPIIMDARELPDKYQSQADYILLDAPCSGLGVLRRKPEVRWRKQPGLIKELQKLNQELLSQTAKCLKPGGTLVYSTCTITREENQDLVEDFIKQNPQYNLGNVYEFLPEQLKEKSGVTPENKGYIQILPQIDGMDGFFIARIEKKQN